MKLNLKIFILLLSLNNNIIYSNNIWSSIRQFFRKAGELLDFIEQKMRPDIKISIPVNTSKMSEYEKRIHERFGKTTNAEGGFVDAYNNMQKNSRGVQAILNHVFTSLFESIKDIITEEKTFREKKQKVFSIKFPKNYSNIKKKINSIFDLDKLLSEMDIPLIFNDEQKVHILKIIKRMQDNIEKSALNPQKKHLYTTQLFISGPPGTGKTQLVYLLSEVVGLPVVILSSSQLILMGYESIRALQEILDEIKISGAILFIDEAELLLMNRDDLLTLTEETYRQNPIQDNNRTEYSEILHRLLNVFLSMTGNKKHNIFVSSNQPMVFDKALSRRFLEFIVLSLPHYVDRIADKYIKMFNIEFSDISIKEAGELFLEYNRILKANGAKTNKKSLAGLSGSDIKVIISYLTQINQPKKINGIAYYTATKSQLMQSIRDRLELYTLFGYNVSLEGGSKLSIDLDDLETEYDKKEREITLKLSNEDLKYTANIKQELIKYLYEKKAILYYNIEVNKNILKYVTANNLIINIVNKKIKNNFDILKLPSYNIIKTNHRIRHNYLKSLEREYEQVKQNFNILKKYKNNSINKNIMNFIERQKDFTIIVKEEDQGPVSNLITKNFNKNIELTQKKIIENASDFINFHYNKGIDLNPEEFIF
jgi:SpoVK/Ycf46/Vps4 family AAA+-type ATPase